MFKRYKTIFAALSLAALCTGVFAQQVILKIAATVPINSPWDRGLQDMASEIKEKTNGNVIFSYPLTARGASESDIIQKMRFGLDGALLSTYGMGEIYPDSLILSMPSLFQSDAEFDAVLQKVKPLIQSQLASKYQILDFSKGGWVRYFSRDKIIYPKDLVQKRVAVNTSNPTFTKLFQAVGARAIRSDPSSLVLQLNSNAIDVIFNSPIFIGVLWPQVKGLLKWMSPFKVSPFVGVFLLNKSAWQKIPEEYRPIVQEIVTASSVKVNEETAKLEASAIAYMEKNMLQEPALPEDAKVQWDKLINDSRDSIIAPLFSKEIVHMVTSTLDEYRSKK